MVGGIRLPDGPECHVRIALTGPAPFSVLFDASSFFNAQYQLAKQGDVDKAEHWLKRMISDGVQSDVVSYSSVINSFHIVLCARFDLTDHGSAGGCRKASASFTWDKPMHVILRGYYLSRQVLDFELIVEMT